MSAMISLNRLQDAKTLKINQNVNVNVQKEKLVSYGDTKPTISKDEYDKLAKENQVLKLVIELMKDNPIKYNGYIITDDIKLMTFIKLLTNADDVQLDVEDIGEGCCTGNIYRKVNAIYVVKGNETKNLKYDYSSVMKELKDINISTKYVW